MSETPFEVGPLRGHRGGSGPPALLLHGGAAVPDYLDGLANELGGRFTTYRYTQRGTPPSEGGPPFTVEQHMADALSVLDAFDIDRAWSVGHSWGGHLALHLLVAHPDRLLGAVPVDTLGAFSDVFAEIDEERNRRLSADEVAELDEIEDRRRAGTVTEAELVRRFELIWPAYFHDPSLALPAPATVGAEASIGTNRSLADHFERGTLREGLPRTMLPVCFVHGELSVLPLSSTERTAELVQGSKVVVVPGVGHFPWVERPGSVRDAVQGFLEQ
ncbi:MAG TPA: alpha/beta hydrolase [Gaiellaceae bacterium]|nr:alpha/beta hydrolase [Gaiellaceae bacterium]